MTLRILSDTHIARQVSIQLRAKGVDIVRLEEVNDLENNAKDRAILEYAIQHGRAVLSLDNDFAALHFELLAQQKSHRGIFLGHPRLQGNIGELVKFIVEYDALIENDGDLDNQLIYIK